MVTISDSDGSHSEGQVMSASLANLSAEASSENIRPQ
jgi:hypothetical protein